MRTSRAFGTFNWVMAAAVVGASVYLSIRTIDSEHTDWIMGVGTRALTYGTIALLVVVGLLREWRTRTLAGAALVRAPFYLVGGLLVAMAGTRAAFIVDPKWKLSPEASMAGKLAELLPEERAEWGAQVVMHRVTTQSAVTPLTVPVEWSFPDDVKIAVVRAGLDSVRVWARASDGTTRCVAFPDDGMPMHPKAVDAKTGCAKGVSAPDETRFVSPPRVAEGNGPGALEMVGAPWPEYRQNGSKTAVATGSTVASGPMGHLDGEIRSSITIVGNVAIAGAHGNGALGGFDIATGTPLWSSRTPNWIHQDAVSDGRIAVVGFGDNFLSFFGRAPSGVAAYAVGSGRHLWTRFDENSVMTSPVVRDSFIVYGTAAGVIKKRSITTGAMLGETRLPGRVIMGPPASAGDTIVFSLDQDGVCAVLAQSMQTLWCRAMPFHLMTGHSAPTVADGIVISSSMLVGRALSLREFAGLPTARQLALLWTVIKPNEAWEFAGQRFQAFRLSDGSPLWSSRAFPSLRRVSGHPAGTAAVRDSIGVIVLPSADSLAGFNVRSGVVLWVAPARGSRGPPLLLEGVAVNSGHDGTTDIRDLVTGQLRCSITRKVGYDRSGPTVAGDMVLLADVKGDIEAIPMTALTRCDPTVVRTSTR